MASHQRYFTRINPPTFYGSQVEEDPQEFIDEIYKILYSIGLSTSEKVDLVTYKLKYVAQTWYIKLRDNRPFRGRSVTWEVFNKAFLDRFFPWEKREAKLVEFINLHQGGMSFYEYSLEFTKLSKYAPFLVSNSRDKMSHFMTVVSEDLQEEFNSTMIHENMKISRLIVHSQHVVEARDKRRSRDAKRARSFDGGSSKRRLEIQHKPRFNKRISNQVPSKFPKSRDDRGRENFFGCGKIRHKVRDFPNIRGQYKGSCKSQTSGSNEVPKKNRFYALRSRSDQDTSPDVVTGTLKVLSIDVYVLLDPGATLSFVTPVVSKRFDILPDILNESFIVSTPVGMDWLHG
ncbi:uncharacterized protein [Solanum lycopersicum]|uniref:uncharacterized protein n=1 Tax=Solanum lycopersicum TaxID=4081 RepID=UPI00374A73F1